MDAVARWRICEEISNSGIFTRYELEPIDLKKAAVELEHPQYSDIPIKILDNVVSQEIINPYSVRRIKFYQRLYPDDDKSEPIPRFKDEHVFACLLKEKDSNQLVPFYVSKEYVSPGCRAHRFVFLKPSEFMGLRIMVAEGSAQVYKSTKRDVELHYLEMRRIHDKSGTINPFNLTNKLRPRF